MALFLTTKRRQPFRTADGIVIAHPHHYQFAYCALPNFLFADPKRAVSLFGAPEGLAALWRSFGEMLRESDRLTDVQPVLLDKDAAPVGSSIAICIRMPELVTKSEAFFVAVLLAQEFATSDTSRDARIRYFALSRCGRSDGFLREVFRDRPVSVALTHRRVRATIPAFLSAISEALSTEQTKP
jgi:hypothetical protein